MDIIISLGGSLIVPDDINIPFLKKFHSLIINYIKGNNRVAIITGGGKTARLYMEAAEKIAKISQHDQDWIGIHTTRLNAQLMRDIFKDHARPEIVKDPTKKFEWKHPILIGAGWKPGCSTDYDAVLLAKNLGIKNIINLTNVDQVYDKDPSKHKDATPIDKMTWPELQAIVGEEWSPGLNAPFDPIATKEATTLQLKVTILGPDLKNLQNFLENKEFKGTTIN
jgi:uridylate kinase|tara:strand:+ start:365 stop:1036 length:672 start_codon:yes stop_codon:yes gene_type:complete